MDEHRPKVRDISENAAKAASAAANAKAALEPTNGNTHEPHREAGDMLARAKNAASDAVEHVKIAAGEALASVAENRGEHARDQAAATARGAAPTDIWCGRSRIALRRSQSVDRSLVGRRRRLRARLFASPLARNPAWNGGSPMSRIPDHPFPPAKNSASAGASLRALKPRSTVWTNILPGPQIARRACVLSQLNE